MEELRGVTPSFSCHEMFEQVAYALLAILVTWGKVFEWRSSGPKNNYNMVYDLEVGISPLHLPNPTIHIVIYYLFKHELDLVYEELEKQNKLILFGS
ncbi:hypothetical protein HN51_064895 [Arachis hypogaea]